MKSENSSEDFSQIEQGLNSLSKINFTRDQLSANRTRLTYSNEIQRLTVSKPENFRLTLQNRINKLFGSGKENFRMSPALISLITAVVLVFGGGSIGVVSAQNSLPDDWLFPIKLATEDIQLTLTNGTEDKIDLEMDLTQNRLDEIVQLLNNNSVPDESQFERLDKHLMTAFKLGMETNTQNAGVMSKLHTRLQEQIHLMEQIHYGDNPSADASLIRTRTMLETQTKFVEDYISALNPQDAGQNGQNSGAALSDNQPSVDQQNLNQSAEQDQDRIMDQDQDQIMQQDQDQDQIMQQDQNQIMQQDQDQIMQQDQDQIMQQDQDRTMEPNGNIDASTPVPALKGNQNSNPDSGSGGGGKGNK